MTGPGILYVVATPIGNLGDITLRAIEVLREADLVVAEDRHRALGLLSHLGLRKPIVTINSYNEQSRARSIAAQLAAGGPRPSSPPQARPASPTPATAS